MPSLKSPKADLRKLYYRAFEISLIVSLTTIIVAFKFSPQASNIEIIKDGTPELITVEDIINTVQKPKPPEPPIVPDLIPSPLPDVPEDILLNDIDDYTPPPLPDTPPINHNIDLSDEDFIPVPEELPQPIGGLKAIQEKVHYTEIAKRIGLEGSIYIQAKIDKKGNVVEATILKGIGGGLDEEALNAVLATKFNPGKQQGKPVNVKMVIPIKFVLK